MTFIDDKYAQLGGAASFLGAPQFPEERITPNGLGSYRHYGGGSIYGRYSTQLAWEVHGLIRERWSELGWENFAGFPVTDETPVPPAAPRGRTSDFEGMVIAWTPATGAHEVYGAILRRWVALGREGGILGFPTTGETGTPDGRGRFNHFEGGSIYWTPQTGAFEVPGQFRDIWADSGWERGPLGYPVSAGLPPGKLPGSPVTFQEFEKGRIFIGIGGAFFRISTTGSAIFTVPDTSIGWNSFALPLPDGDRVAVAFTGNPGNNPNRPITITLRIGPAVTWWKAISLWSPSRGDIREASNQGGRISDSFTLTPAELESPTMMLVFKKAKGLGVHTGMYWLGPLVRLLGTDVTFTWLAD